jgi:hypothetical protein
MTAAFVTAPCVADAQSRADFAEPKTPTACLEQIVKPALQRAWKAQAAIREKTYTIVKDKKAEEEERRMMTAISDSALRVSAQSCVGRYPLQRTAAAELLSLEQLHIHARNMQLADDVFRKRLALAKSVTQKAEVLSQSMEAYQYWGEDIRGAAIREKLVVMLDELGDEALPYRVKGHYTMGLVWPETEMARRVGHARRTVELGKRLEPKDRSKLADKLSYMYIQLAHEYQRSGEFDHAAAIVDSGLKALSGIELSEYDNLPGYGMLGKPAPVIAASHWFNAPEGASTYEPGRGKLTVIEYTSYG